MKAKEKAKLLYRMYKGFNSETREVNHITAKQCAELLCDEMINNCPFKILDDDIRFDSVGSRIDASIMYWEEVKKEVKIIRI